MNVVVGRLPSDPYDGELGVPVPLSIEGFEPGAQAYLVMSVFTVNRPCYYSIDGTLDGTETRLGGGLVTGDGWQTCATLMDWEWGHPGEIALRLSTAPIENQDAGSVQFQNFRLAIIDV
jgi:hypothetical protein